MPTRLLDPTLPIYDELNRRFGHAKLSGDVGAKSPNGVLSPTLPNFPDHFPSEFRLGVSLSSLHPCKCLTPWSGFPMKAGRASITVGGSALLVAVGGIDRTCRKKQVSKALIFDSVHDINADLIVANAGPYVAHVANIHAMRDRTINQFPGKNVSASPLLFDTKLPVAILTIPLPKPARIWSVNSFNVRPEPVKPYGKGIGRLEVHLILLTGLDAEPVAYQRPPAFHCNFTTFSEEIIRD